MSRRGDPSRFDEFEEFKDGTGFTIYENDRYIDFYFDKYRGWFDEDGNYYNQDGIRSKPSGESLRFWDSIKSNYQQDDIEDLVNQYDDYYDDDDDPDEQEIALQITKQIHDLKIKLNPYPNNSEIKIFFEGLNWKLDEKKVQQYLGQQHVKRVEFYKTNLGHKNGKGFLIAFNKQSALEIIKFHKTEIDGHNIRFHIEALTYDSDEDVTIIKQDEQLKAQIKEVTQQIKHDVQQQQEVKLEKQDVKQVVKQEVKQEIKQEQVQQKQPQQQVQQKQEQNQQNNEKMEEIFVVVSNLPEKETSELLVDWIVKKGYPQTWFSVQNKNEPKNNRCRFDFHDDKEAENFKKFIEKNSTYKGKTTLKVIQKRLS